MSKTEMTDELSDAIIGEPYDALIGEPYDALIDETGSLGYRWEERSGEERRLSLALYDHAYDAGHAQGERDGYAAAEAALREDLAAAQPVGRWRTGNKLGRTLYRDEVCVGIVDTPEIAAELVAAANGNDMRRLRAEYDRGRQAGRHDVGKYANAIGRIDCALGRVGAKPLDETVRAVEELAEKLRLVAAVADRGPRFTDRHMESAAEQVVDELRAALRGEGL